MRACKNCGGSLAAMRADAVWCSEACRVAYSRVEAAQSPNTKGLTQRQRVLLALHRSGDRGITRVDFLLPHVVDGGDPIVHVGARIKDLRDEGFQIEAGPERRHKCVVYKLRASLNGHIQELADLERQNAKPQPAEPPPSGSLDASDETGQLFDLPPARKHDQEAA